MDMDEDFLGDEQNEMPSKTELDATKSQTELLKQLAELQIKCNEIVEEVKEGIMKIDDSSSASAINNLNSLIKCDPNISYQDVTNLLEFINRPEMPKIEPYKRQIIFKLLVLYSKLLNGDVILNNFLNYCDKWMLDECARDFMVQIAAIIGTKFHDFETFTHVRQAQLGVQGLNSQYEDFCFELASRSKSRILKPPIIDVENSTLYKRLVDMKFTLSFEEQFVKEILPAMLCAGIPAIRYVATKKILTFLNQVRLIKVVTHLITMIIFNLNLPRHKTDTETLRILLKLKIKRNLEILIDDLLSKFLVNNPKNIWHVINIFMEMSNETTFQLVIRSVNICRVLLTTNLHVLVNVFIDHWYIGGDKSHQFLANCFRTEENSQFITVFASFLFESYNARPDSPIDQFLIKVSKFITCLVVESFYFRAEQQRALPSFSIRSSQTPPYMDEQLTSIIYKVRILYLNFMGMYLSRHATLDPLITKAFCDGVTTILMLKPVDYYLPKVPQWYSDELNYQYIIMQLLLHILSDKFDSILVKIIDFFHPYSILFSSSILDIHEIFIKLFDVFLHQSGELKTNVLHTANILLQNDFIIKIFNISSTELIGSEARNIYVTILLNLQKIYSKLFLMSPIIVSGIVFEQYLLIKYMLLSLTIPGFNIPQYVSFENARLITISPDTELPSTHDVHNKHEIRIDIKKDLFYFRNFDASLAVVLYECPSFVAFMERLWAYSCGIPGGKPHNIYQNMSFLPSLINLEKVGVISKLPKIILLSYLVVNYYRSFLVNEKLLNQNVINALLIYDFKTILPYIKSMLGFTAVATPALVIFFLLTGKAVVSTDYRIESDHLNSYELDPKFFDMKGALKSAIVSSLIYEDNSGVVVNVIKMMRIVKSPDYNHVISNWIVSKYHLAALVLENYNLFGILNEIFNDCVKEFSSPLYILAVELLMASVPKLIINTSEYSNLRSSLIQGAKNFYFDIDYFSDKPQIFTIFKTSDDQLISFFITHINYTDILISMRFLFKCLQHSLYFLIPTTILLSILSEYYEKHVSLEIIGEWVQVLELVFKIHGCKLDSNKYAISKLILSHDLENNHTKSVVIRKTSNSIIRSMQCKYEEKNDFSNSGSNTCDIKLAPDLHSPTIIKHKKTESVTISDNSIDKFMFCKKITAIMRRDIVKALKVMGKYSIEINHFISYPDLVDFISRISINFNHSFLVFSSDILKMVNSLKSHPQLFLHQRQSMSTYQEIGHVLPNDNKFMNMLVECLVFDNTKEYENTMKRLKILYVLWVHALKFTPFEKIELVFFKHNSNNNMNFYEKSQRFLMIYLHLNNPFIFYDIVYDDEFEIDDYFEVFKATSQTTMNEHVLKVIQNSFECLSEEIPSNLSALRFLYFCKIFKLYPLLIYYNLAFLLSCFCMNLKTLTFLKTSPNRLRIESFLVFRLIFNNLDSAGLLDEYNSQVLKIEELLDLIDSGDKFKCSIDEGNIDNFIFSLNTVKGNEEIVPDISPTKLAYWLINHPVKKLTELRKQLAGIGENLNRFYNEYDCKISFLKSLFPLLAISSHSWQDRIFEKIFLSESKSETEAILDVVENDIETFSIFGDYFKLFSNKV